jgi:hypothetical protein
MKKISRKKIEAFKNRDLNNLPDEKWREIPFTEGYYLISNYGRVKSLSRYLEKVFPFTSYWTKEKISRQSCSKSKNHYRNDYTFGMVVSYQFNKQKFRSMVRRLVYEAFIQPISKMSMKGKRVYNKDGNGLNSHVSNLDIATPSKLRKIQLENDRYIPPAWIIDQVTNRKHLLKMNRKKRRRVTQYLINGKFVKEFPSITIASLKTGVSISCICSCAHRQLLQTKGFVWRFEGDIYDGEFHSNSPQPRQIVQYSLKGEEIKIFPAINEAMRQTGVLAGSIIRCAKRGARQAGGYVWRYVDDSYY